METITLKRDPKDTHLLENFFGKKKLEELRSLKSNDPQEKLKNYYEDPRWRKLSSLVLKENQKCILCGKQSKDVHHLLKFGEQFEEENKERLLLDRDNCIAVCKSCHLHGIHGNKLNPNQRQFIENLKTKVYNKYESQRIMLRWTFDENHR